MEKTNIQEYTRIGVIAALTFLAAFAIHIPIGPGGVIHLGDSIIFVAAILFGKRYAAISGAIGMTIFDIISGYSVWAPYTFVIKALMGYTAGVLCYSFDRKGDSVAYNIIAIVVSGILMIGGYYVAEALIYGNWLAPIATVSANVFQVVGGGVIAIPVTFALKKTRYFTRLQ